jgi:hypothetical protein
LRRAVVAAGYPHAAIIGEMRRGVPGVEVSG